MKITKILLGASLLLGQQFIAQETEGIHDSKHHNKWSVKRPDGHAPISVMGDHTHHKGAIMFSYRYLNMYMEDLQQGKDDISASNALAEGDMYPPSNDITLMVMASYITNNMDLQTGIGFNIYSFKGSLKKLRFGTEYALPVYQDLKEIQLSQKQTITLGLQYS